MTLSVEFNLSIGDKTYGISSFVNRKKLKEGEITPDKISEIFSFHVGEVISNGNSKVNSELAEIDYSLLQELGDLPGYIRVIVTLIWNTNVGIQNALNDNGNQYEFEITSVSEKIVN